MTRLEWTRAAALVAAVGGCAGKIDHSLDFERTSASTTAGAQPDRPGVAGGGPSPEAGGSRPPMMSASSGSTTSTADAGIAQRSAPSAGHADVGAPAACDFRELMQAKCGSASCHGGPANKTGLDLTSTELATRVDGRMGKGACTDHLLIDRTQPEQSKLYLKLTGTTCGQQMPLTGKLTDDEQACVLTWIGDLPARQGGTAGQGGAAGAEAVAADKTLVQPSSAGKVASEPRSAGSGGAATMSTTGPACDFSGLIRMKCGNTSCHGAPALSTGLDLTSPSLATRLEGVRGKAGCTESLLLDKDDPKKSVLYLTVAGSDCGTRMPLGGTLTADEQGCVLSWIEGL